ncbi:U2 small nuclear ribonucleoprotein auxiliary factor 35 kDa subunit-related protein 2-like isoform X2 [Liolophura sinensis]|uniref:U2 small nuclear ribonucleoprotein auxiliary factor 35 kDa subunit-related protein 2-like isoform X2 n=1 Tax=Liolophura sinensis TaxID=3198878 RepID=UPI00315810DF
MALDEEQSKLQISSKLSRKQWRALKKKEKRRAIRKTEAQEREAQRLTGVESSASASSDEEKTKEEERIREEQHHLWLEREEAAQREWQQKKEREERERLRIEAQKKQIQAEWEERERKEKEEAEEREKKEAVKREKQEALLKEATANENKGNGAWHNPIAPMNYGKEQLRETCPFFRKTGACRFGDRCSRAHPEPEDCTTLLFPGMYSSFVLEQTLRDEYDMDIGLEYEEGETYQHFKDFYYDVLPEFKSMGRVVQFKVCCNFEPHLRGNVYVQFYREDEAQAAFAKFNGRYYGGKQLSAQFVSIERWKLAICGLYGRKQCPKGKNCNFLHVFRNPGNEFRDADMDFERSTRGWGTSQRERSESSRYDKRERNGRYHGDRSSHRKSRSRSRSHRRSRSSHRQGKRSVDRKSRHSRSRSRSRSRARSRNRSHKGHSQSPDEELRKRQCRRSRSRSRSPARHRGKRRDRCSSVAGQSREANEPRLDSREIISEHSGKSIKIVSSTLLDRSQSSSSSNSDVSDVLSKARKKKSKSHRKHKERKKEKAMFVNSVSKSADSESISKNSSASALHGIGSPSKLALVDEIIQQSLTE